MLRRKVRDGEEADHGREAVRKEGPKEAGQEEVRGDRGVPCRGQLVNRAAGSCPVLGDQ